MRLATIAVALTLTAGIAIAEDRLILKDGQVVAGQIVTESDSDVQILSNEKTLRVPRTTIDRVERAGAMTASASAPTAPPGRPPRPAEERAAHGPMARTAHEATPEFLKWIDMCVQHLTSTDAGVHQGAVVALRAAGTAAKPALEKAASSDNAKLSQAATAVLGQIGASGHPLAERRPNGSRGQPGGAVLRQLGLTDEQQPKVEQILLQHDKAQEEVAKSAREGKIPKDQAKTKMTALRADTDEKLSKVLSAEQMKKYKELNAPPIAEGAR